MHKGNAFSGKVKMNRDSPPPPRNIKAKISQNLWGGGGGVEHLNWVFVSGFFIWLLGISFFEDEKGSTSSLPTSQQRLGLCGCPNIASVRRRERWCTPRPHPFSQKYGNSRACKISQLFPTASVQTENQEHKQLLLFIGKAVNFSSVKG